MTANIRTPETKYKGASISPLKIGFEIADATHLSVVKADSDDVETTLVKDTDYTVSSDLDDITLTTELVSGERLTITRSVPLTQTTSYYNAANSLKKNLTDIESSLDVLTYIYQDLDLEYTNSPQLDDAVYSSIQDVEVPDPGAGKFLKWNSTADGIVLSPDTSVAGISDIIEDTSPQLGGDFNFDNYDIVTTSNADIELSPNGTGVVYLKGNLTKPAEIRFEEDADNGSNYVALKSPSLISSNLSLTLPSTDGTDGQYIKTDGSGNLGYTTNTNPDRTLVSTLTLAGNSSLEITGLDGTYQIYEIEFIDVEFDTGYPFITVTTSSDGGTTYDSGAGNYRYVNKTTDSAGSTTYYNSDSATGMAVGVTSSTGRGVLQKVNGKITLYNPVQIGRRKAIGWEFNTDNNLKAYTISGVGSRLSDAQVNAIKLTSGQFLHPFSPSVIPEFSSGSIKVYGKTSQTAPSVIAPNHSIDFERSSTQVLAMLKSVFGNFSDRKVGISFWYKLESSGSDLGTFFTFFEIVSDSQPAAFNSAIRILMNGGDKFAINCTFDDGMGGIGEQPLARTSTTFPDKTSWHHLYFKIDTTQATESDRIAIYHDGTLQSIDSAYTLAQNSDLVYGLTGDPDFVTWGGSVDLNPGGTGVLHYDGKLYQMAVFDGDSGSLPDITDLYDSGSPKDITGISSLYSLVYDPLKTDPTLDYVLADDWDDRTSDIGAGDPTIDGSDIPS